jgi:peptidoglycan hydrolase-like protein with peptidoglycan-binding domain
LLRDRIGIKLRHRPLRRKDIGKVRSAMRGCAWWAGSAAIAISLCWLLPARAVAAGRMVKLAQNAADQGASEPGQPPATGAPATGTPAALPANPPEQIRKAQIELRRLDCLKGRIDGKLGDQTRQAVKNFWASAKRPAVELNITDALIADLAERGDNFCRPPRPFFALGGRRSGNSAVPPLFPGARPIPAPPPAPDTAR